MSGLDMSGGVVINPMPPETRRDVTINYSGMLANAQGVSICLNYGGAGQHFGNKEVSMKRVGNAFQATFQIDASDQLNFYFKDDQGKVDNNNGRGWSSQVASDYQSYA
ncbi:MAG: hypothetical protein ACM3PE_12885 [Deltaproteobacteria bacterium]